MSYRKVQELRGSFYLYLPKEWCKKVSLKSKTEIKIQEMEDGSLLIRPIEGEKKDNGVLILEIDKATPDLIKAFIRASYVIGAKKLILNSKEPIAIEKREIVASITRDLLGFEIIEETDNKIILGDIGFGFELIPIIKRLFTSVHFMLDVAKEALTSNNIALAKSVINRDNDVDRYYYVTERLNHVALENPAYIWDNKLTLMDILHFNVAAKFIERIGDHVVGILYELIENQEISDNIKVLFKSIVPFYEMTYQLFFIKDFKDLQLILFERNKLENEIKNMFSIVKSRMQVFHIRRILRYCVDLGQIAIYQSLGKKIKSKPIEKTN